MKGTMITKDGLEQFGKLLIQRVRDEAIEDWAHRVDGTSKGLSTKKVQRALRGWTHSERETLKSLVPGIVDSVLHHLMWTVEQESSIRLSMKDGAQLRDLSDGLPVDLLNWRDKFAKQPVFDLVGDD